MLLKEKNEPNDYIKYYCKLLNIRDIEAGLQSKYYYNIYLKKEKKLENKNIEYCFNIRSFRDYANCIIEICKSNNEILKLECDCSDFKKEHSCRHLPIILYEEYDTIFNITNDENFLSNALLKRYKYEETGIKKEIKLEINIIANIEYDSEEPYFYILLKPKIGYNKMYSLDTKFNSFYDALKNHGLVCKFGKELEYNSKDYYLNSKNLKIIEYLKDFNDNSRYSNNDYKISLSLKRILNDKDCYPLIINNHVINYYKEEFPILSKISNDKNNYKIQFDINNLYPIYATGFFYKDGELFKPNDREAAFVQDLIDNNIEKLSIPKDKKYDFTNSILKIIKDKVEIDDVLKDDIIVISKPDVELYFDIDKSVSCKIILNYKGKEINYFDNDSSIVRDKEYENNVVSYIQCYGFDIDNKKIILSEINKIVNFLEHDIDDISKYYKVFTSKKIKSINIRNKTNVSSTFSIGRDNIISYEFNLDDIRSDELVNIFKEIKNKKKYYRLKNGDILNLEDDNIRELENIQDEMEISDEDIINAKGTIQKYRVLYLDSLNNTKYKHTSVDSLFYNFIDNFYKSKNAVLTIENTDILRDYQLIGVKWLYNIYKTGFGGILADEMGLGKTIQSIYFIKQVLKDKPNAKFLIVVPTALVYNWKHEFEMFGNDVSIAILSGHKSRREETIKNKVASVYITSYGILREDESFYENKRFEVMIIDEAQTIKNFTSGISKIVKSIKSNVKFALTGTPVENSPFELWSIFDYIMPGYLGSINKFKNKYKIRDFDEKTSNLLNGLSNQIRPFILRRKKKDVIKELPDKIENNIYVELTEKQKIIYAAESEKVKKEIEESNFSNIRFKVLQLLMKLRQVCIDPAIVYENYDGGSNKIDMLILLLKERISNNSKTLVFTSFRSPINIISKRLKDENIDYYIIDGSITGFERNKRVNEFNERNTPAVFLITLQSGGVGLNLASASTVIHLDYGGILKWKIKLPIEHIVLVKKMWLK